MPDTNTQLDLAKKAVDLECLPNALIITGADYRDAQNPDVIAIIARAIHDDTERYSNIKIMPSKIIVEGIDDGKISRIAGIIESLGITVKSDQQLLTTSTSAYEAPAAVEDPKDVMLKEVTKFINKTMREIPGLKTVDGSLTTQGELELAQVIEHFSVSKDDMKAAFTSGGVLTNVISLINRMQADGLSTGGTLNAKGEKALEDIIYHHRDMASPETGLFVALGHSVEAYRGKFENPDKFSNRDGLRSQPIARRVLLAEPEVDTFRR